MNFVELLNWMRISPGSMFAIFALFPIAWAMNDGRRLITVIGILLYWSINWYFEVYLVFWVFLDLKQNTQIKCRKQVISICLFFIIWYFVLFCFLVSKLASIGQKWWRFVFNSLDLFIGYRFFGYWYASSVNSIFVSKSWVFFVHTNQWIIDLIASGQTTISRNKKKE